MLPYRNAAPQLALACKAMQTRCRRALSGNHHGAGAGIPGQTRRQGLK